MVHLSLKMACPACQRSYATADRSFVAPRSGEGWVGCSRCSQRFLYHVLPAGATGRYLQRILGDHLAAGALRRYMPALAGLEDDELWPLPLVAGDAPAPAHMFIGAVPGRLVHRHHNAPLLEIVAALLKAR